MSRTTAKFLWSNICYMTHNLLPSFLRYLPCVVTYFVSRYLETEDTVFSVVCLKGEGESLGYSQSKNNGRELESKWRKHAELNVENFRLLSAWNGQTDTMCVCDGEPQGVYYSKGGQMIEAGSSVFMNNTWHAHVLSLTRCHSFKPVSKKPVMRWLTLVRLKRQSLLYGYFLEAVT